MKNKSAREGALKEYRISTRDLLGLGVRWNVVWGYFMEEAAFEIDLKGR